MSNYELVEKIGQGGMGIVYRAIQHPLERIVALKVLPSSLMTNPNALPRFLREVRACTALNHPNIIKILDCGELKGQPFYAMEYLEAKTIRELVTETGPLAIATVVGILAQILEALGYCHREGVIHRDIKPHNIMVDRHQQATLMDFGLVKILDASGITRDRMILGTPNYVPPEMLRGEEVEQSADLFSLATVAYEMLTGEKAFPGKGIRDIAARILASDPTPIDRLRPDCPSGLTRILARCLKKQPAERYPSAEEVVNDLIRLEVGVTIRNTTAIRRTQAPAGRGRPVESDEGAPRADRLDKTTPGSPTGKVRRPRAPRRPWSGRQIAIGLAVWVLVGVATFEVLRPRQVISSATPPAEPADLVAEYGVDWVEIRWTSDAAYQGQVGAQTIVPPILGLDARESAPTSQHRVRLDHLDVARTYRFRLSRDGTLLGPGRLFSTLTRAAAAAQLLEMMSNASVSSLVTQIETEAMTLPPARPGKNEPKIARFRERWNRALKTRFETFKATDRLAALGRHHRAYFADKTAPSDIKRRLWMALESLENLRIHCWHLQLEFPLDFRLENFKSPRLGPDPEPLTKIDGQIGITFERKNPRGSLPVGFRWAGTAGEFHSIVLPGSEALTQDRLGQGLAFVSFAPRDPLTFPDRLERIQASLVVGKLAPQNRFVLSIGPAPDRLNVVAVFRSRTDGRCELTVELDPQWIRGPAYIRLDFGLAPAILSVAEHRARVFELVFRYQKGLLRTREGSPAPFKPRKP